MLYFQGERRRVRWRRARFVRVWAVRVRRELERRRVRLHYEERHVPRPRGDRPLLWTRGLHLWYARVSWFK